VGDSCPRRAFHHGDGTVPLQPSRRRVLGCRWGPGHWQRARCDVGRIDADGRSRWRRSARRNGGGVAWLAPVMGTAAPGPARRVPSGPLAASRRAGARSV